jgi:hypothetical protein
VLAPKNSYLNKSGLLKYNLSVYHKRFFCYLIGLTIEVNNCYIQFHALLIYVVITVSFIMLSFNFTYDNNNQQDKYV